MNGAVPVFNFGSLLIESPSGENEEQLRAYLTELLVEIYGQLPDWLKFKIGCRFERNGTFYREFLCPAGSVDSRIQLFAQQPGGISRSIILHGRRSDAAYCCEIRLGIESEFDCDELRESND